jgi:hypothetical protein
VRILLWIKSKKTLRTTPKVTFSRQNGHSGAKEQHNAFYQNAQRALGKFLRGKKVGKLTKGKIFHPFFGLFWGGFGPVMQLFGGVS